MFQTLCQMESSIACSLPENAVWQTTMMVLLAKTGDILWLEGANTLR